MRVNDEYTDVLQNIEWAIVMDFRVDPSLLDLDVADAVDGLIRHISREAEGLGVSDPRLSPPASRVFGAIKRICDWRMGRVTGENLETTSQSS